MLMRYQFADLTCSFIVMNESCWCLQNLSLITMRSGSSLFLLEGTAQISFHFLGLMMQHLCYRMMQAGDGGSEGRTESSTRSTQDDMSYLFVCFAGVGSSLAVTFPCFISWSSLERAPKCCSRSCFFFPLFIFFSLCCALYGVKGGALNGRIYTSFLKALLGLGTH